MLNEIARLVIWYLSSIYHPHTSLAGVRNSGWFCHCGPHHDHPQARRWLLLWNELLTQESVLKSTPRPLHRSKDDGNLLRPSWPLLVQRGLLHPGEAVVGLLAAEDRHHLGSSARPQSGAASEATPLLAVSPLLPSILLAEQVGHDQARQLKSTWVLGTPDTPHFPGPVQDLLDLSLFLYFKHRN